MDLMFYFVDEHLEHVVFVFFWHPLFMGYVFKGIGKPETLGLGESHPILMLYFCWAAVLEKSPWQQRHAPKGPTKRY